MDAHLFRILAPVIADRIARSRLQGAHAPLADVTVLTFYGDFGKFRLVWRHHASRPFCYLTEDPPLPNPAFPPDRVMRVRKHAEGHRLPLASLDWINRRMAFAVPGAETTAGYLVLDMREGVWFSPELDWLAPAPPLWPDMDWLRQYHQNLGPGGSDTPWRDWPVLTPALRKSLDRLPLPDAAALLADLETGQGDVFIYRHDKGVLLSAWPLDDTGIHLLSQTRDPKELLACLREVGQNRLGELAATSQAEPERQEEKREQRRLARRARHMAEERERFAAVVAQKNAALALQARLWELEGVDLPERITLDLPDGSRADIDLDTRLSPGANLQRIFARIAKAERGLAHLARREGLTHDGPRRNTAAKQNAPQPAAQSDVFVSSDGFRILRGKNARSNRMLLREAHPFDIWVHTEDGPSAHCIIRRDHASREVPEQTLLEAGCLAALKSPFQHAGRAAVQFALVKHVRPVRGSEGKVTVDTRWRTLVAPVDPALEERLRHPS